MVNPGKAERTDLHGLQQVFHALVNRGELRLDFALHLDMERVCGGGVLQVLPQTLSKEFFKDGRYYT